jgi:hypothetical protein
VPDALIDAAADPCLDCTADQLCVHLYDGICRGAPVCVARTVDCPNNVCTPECQSAYCGSPSPYHCTARPPCGGESPRAFTCYGP